MADPSVLPHNLDPGFSLARHTGAGIGDLGNRADVFRLPVIARYCPLCTPVTSTCQQEEQNHFIIVLFGCLYVLKASRRLWSVSLL